MAVWDTTKNKRSWMTKKSLTSLMKGVDWKKHRLFVVDNGSCNETHKIYKNMLEKFDFTLLINDENIGVANAINKAWQYRHTGEHVCRIDNDIVVNHTGWADEIDSVLNKSPHIGICGLKLKTLPHCPYKLILLPHQPGDKWVVVEKQFTIVGACQCCNHLLLDKIGYLYQSNWKYGYEDIIWSYRSRLSGFDNVYLSHIDVDHIDLGDTEYALEKIKTARSLSSEFKKLILEYDNGQRDLYYDGGKYVQQENIV